MHSTTMADAPKTLFSDLPLSARWLGRGMCLCLTATGVSCSFHIPFFTSFSSLCKWEWHTQTTKT